MRGIVTVINRLKSDENGATLGAQVVVLAAVTVAVIAIITGIGHEWIKHGIIVASH
jgi:hypothetical protein